MGGLDLSEGADPVELQQAVKALRDRQAQLGSEVGDLLTNMEAGSTIVAQFQVITHISFKFKTCLKKIQIYY